MIKLLTGDCRKLLKTLPDESVHCVVTSPPYWGLRDYGTAKWEGGDVGCNHRAPSRFDYALNAGLGPTGVQDQASNAGSGSIQQYRGVCGKCGARRIDSQIGLEPSPQDYVATMVEVFREVRRVLRKEGTLWLNLGDSYNNRTKVRETSHQPALNGFQDDNWAERAARGGIRMSNLDGLKEKDLVGIPWRVAFALQQPYYIGRIKSERDRIWLAAMIDAEGCMFIHKRKEGNRHDTYTKKDGTVSEYIRSGDNYGAGLEIANTHEAVIQRCLQITGQGSHFKREKDRRQPLWRWNMRSNECRAIIQEIYPYLVAKQHQARLLLGCPANGPRAEAAHQGLIDLHNGKSVDIDFPPPASMYEPGWYLRQDIIWSKLNPMPESVRDRCTKAHEYIFLLSKNERYYYDANAIREPFADASIERLRQDIANQKGSDRVPGKTNGSMKAVGLNANRSSYRPGSASNMNNGEHVAKSDAGLPINELGRNKRSVWEVTTVGYADAHFATFPPALIEPCILAGCPKGGIVLDPFGGAGTTGLVADRLERNAVLIELNNDYAEMARKRISGDAPLFAEVV